MVEIQRLVSLPRQAAASDDRAKGMPGFRVGDRLTAAVMEVFNGSDALLSFGAFKAYARLPAPVVKGQTVHLDVVAGGHGLQMAMVTAQGPDNQTRPTRRLPIALIETLGDQPLPTALADVLNSGDVMTGRVTGFVKEGRQLVAFDQFKAFVAVDGPVRPGQIVPLTVLIHDGELVLRAARERLSPPTASQTANPAGGIAPPPGEVLMRLREHVQRLLDGTQRPMGADIGTPFGATVAGALHNLERALHPGSTMGPVDPLIDRIREFVEHSGVYFEKHLARTIAGIQIDRPGMTSAEIAAHPAIHDLMVKDIKPNLLIIKKYISNLLSEATPSDRLWCETINGLVDRALVHVEQQQIAVMERPTDPGVLHVFAHLFFLLDQPRCVRLNVHTNRKTRGGPPRPPRVSMLLDMDRMGALRADLWMAGRDLNITFFVQDADIKTAIDAEHHRIVAGLGRLFDSIAVSVVVNEDKIDAFDGEDLRPTGCRQVDLCV